MIFERLDISDSKQIISTHKKEEGINEREYEERKTFFEMMEILLNIVVKSM